uniref:hypothetical protein n=1 Tax=Vibrio anguillarum TaxID=55601 RepID=UPI001F1AAB75
EIVINLYKALFKELDENDIVVSVWKSLDRLDCFISGNEDLDLWVSVKYKGLFEKTLNSLGFLEFFPFVNKFEYVTHFYAFAEGKIVHLHVYYKIVTGESNTKNYILPLEIYLERESEKRLGVTIPSIELSRTIFMIRLYLKSGSLYGALLLLRDDDKYRGERDYLNLKSKPDILYIPDFIDDHLIDEMLDNIVNENLFKRFWLSYKVKNALKTSSRMSELNHFFYKIKDFSLRVANKLIFKRKKRAKKGLVLSICGLDGSGKSTAVENVGRLMKKNFDYKLVHLGRPAPTLFTLPFWLIFRLAERVKHSEKSAERSVESFLPNPNVSLLAAIRYCIIAIERKAAAIKAQAYSKNGYIVITDRYPSLEYGKMDSPRITKNTQKSCIYNFLHN